MDRYDVVVIGGGIAGPSAAQVARARGKSVLVIEEDRLGGECLWRGCVPTKTLIECGRVLVEAEHAEEFGVEARDVHADYRRALRRRDRVVQQVAQFHSPERLQRQGIDVLHGHATFEDSHTVRVGDRSIRGEALVMAVGSRPAFPPIPGLADVGAMTHHDLLQLTQLPKSLLIIGGGVIGCEFAQLVRRFDVEVTVVEAFPTLLFREDPDVCQLAEEVFRSEGIVFHTGARVLRAEHVDGRPSLIIDRGGAEERLVADALLVATGRVPHVDGLQLEAAGIATDRRGAPVVQGTLQTNVPHIWACGDAVGRLLFANAAAHQGHHVGSNIGASEPRALDERVVPRAIFIEPEIASVGMTEPEAAASHDIVAVMVPIAASDRALMMGECVGFVKLIADHETGEILGGHIMASRAGDLIHEVALAMFSHLPVAEVAAMLYLYPSLLEPLRLAAEAAEAQRQGRMRPAA